MGKLLSIFKLDGPLSKLPFIGDVLKLALPALSGAWQMDCNFKVKTNPNRDPSLNANPDANLNPNPPLTPISRTFCTKGSPVTSMVRSRVDITLLCVVTTLALGQGLELRSGLRLGLR